MGLRDCSDRSQRRTIERLYCRIEILFVPREPALKESAALQNTKTRV